MADLLNIAFMGSGAFSVPVLQALLNCSQFRICAVITQPDKEAGRKRVLTPTPLGKYSDDHGIPCMRVKSVNDRETLDYLHSLNLDLIVVVSFGQILKEEILDMPELGCLNVHASILPRYRGASPIASCIVNGDCETGVSFMQMERGLDSGPIYEVHTMPVDDMITTGELELKLAELAASKIEACITSIAYGSLVPRVQPEMLLSYAAKITKKDGYVDWNDDAARIARKIRAYAKWPSMSCRCVTRSGRIITLKMTRARCTAWRDSNATPGKITAVSDDGIMIACGVGSLLLLRVVPEGKKEMRISDFRNGTPLNVGDVLLNGAVPDVPAPNQVEQPK